MALSRHHAALSRPRSVNELVEEASDFDFTTTRPLQQWLRAAKMLLTEASICEQEGNLAMAYLYLYRHAQLILTKLPDHPEYKDSRFKPQLSQARRTIQANLVKLEQWKPRINFEHQRYVKAMERRNAERQRAQNEFDQAEKRLSFAESRRASLLPVGTRPFSPVNSLNANENRELAVNLAQSELVRRAAHRKLATQAGVSPATVAERRKGLVAGELEAYEKHIRPEDGVREAGRHLQHQPNPARREQPLSHQSTSSSFRYPTVPQKEGRIDWQRSAPMSSSSQPRQTLPPALPAKEILSQDRTPNPSLGWPPPPRPPRPDALDIPSPRTGSPPPEESAARYTFRPTAFTESGAPLRTVLLPPDLRTTFLNLAHPNTARNVETCGILCATVISNALFINTLIIPDQTSTSDTCDTTEAGEIALFDYCDHHSLLVCGWIHTHPSQSCFLSSRDLHTSSGYQVMLPEAIAIVCSPRHTPNWGIFRLTDPPGLTAVLNCTQQGLFHPHPEPHLYTDALRPGHVVEGPGLKFELVDLRES